MKDRRLLQKRVDDLTQELGLTGDFNAHDFINALNQRMNLSIRAASMEMPPGHTGFLAKANEGYVLLYKENTSWIHQQHIIFHECAHILLGHRSTELNESFHRTDFDDEAEREAEFFATTVLERALKCSIIKNSASPIKDRNNYDLIPEKLLEEATLFFSHD